MTPIVKQFISDVGNVTQSFGLGRGIGQVFACLYFSKEPKNLAQMQDALGISKGVASSAVRQLEQWGAVRKVWVKGDRKDYYQADDWLGKILKNVLLDVAGKKMVAYQRLLEGLDVADVADAVDGDDPEFIKKRIEHLKDFHKRAEDFWNSRWLRVFLE